MDLRALFEEWISWRIATGTLGLRSSASVRSRLSGLLKLYAHHDPRQIGRQQLARWQATTGRYGPSYRAHQVSGVRQFFAWMLEQGAVDTDPTFCLAKVRQPQAIPRALVADQPGAVLTAPMSARDRAIVATMLYCALRCIEISRLDLDDWDRAHELLVVTGKGGDEGLVPVPPELVGYLDAYLKERGSAPGPMFQGVGPRSSKDRRLTATYISSLVSRLMARAGVHRFPGDGRTAHALRHTAATDTADRCRDPRVVQQFLRHRSLQSTDRYMARVRLDRVRDAVGGRDYLRPTGTHGDGPG